MQCLQDGSGKIEINELREICVQFNLPIDNQMLEALFDYCDVDHDGLIDYVEFSNFLNWKDKLPSGIRVKDDTSKVDMDTQQQQPEELHKQIDVAVVDFKKSSEMISATVGGVTTTGIPL